MLLRGWGRVRALQAVVGVFAMAICLAVGLLLAHRRSAVLHLVSLSLDPNSSLEELHVKFFKVFDSPNRSAPHVPSLNAYAASVAVLVDGAAAAHSMAENSLTTTTAVDDDTGEATKDGDWQASEKVITLPEEWKRSQYDFGYILNEPDKCSASPELVMVVCTGASNWDKRQAIRETWGSVALHPPSRVILVFLLGSTASAEAQARVVEESHSHHDIVQADFLDSYRNLTLKSLTMLRWVKTFCPNAKYALKSDDDMYINVPNLLSSLKKVKLPKFILGYVFAGARPKRNRKSKWYVSMEQFDEAVFPNYTSGTSYAMTASSTPDLFHACLRLSFFLWEDVFVTGMCARKAAIPRINDAKFSPFKRRISGCVFRRVISGHGYSVAEIRKIHSELVSSSLTCS